MKNFLRFLPKRRRARKSAQHTKTEAPAADLAQRVREAYGIAPISEIKSIEEEDFLTRLRARGSL